MRLAPSTLLLGCVAALFGCVRAEAFECDRDNQCRSDTITGVCVPTTGFCAFESETCLDDSFARYGLAVGDGLAAQCVLCSDFGGSFCGPDQDSCSDLGCQVCLACAASDGECEDEKQDCEDSEACTRDFEDLIDQANDRDPLESTEAGAQLHACLAGQCSQFCLD